MIHNVVTVPTSDGRFSACSTEPGRCDRYLTAVHDRMPKLYSSVPLHLNIPAYPYYPISMAVLEIAEFIVFGLGSALVWLIVVCHLICRTCRAKRQPILYLYTFILVDGHPSKNHDDMMASAGAESAVGFATSVSPAVVPVVLTDKGFE